jgi:hypothetical protein
VAVHDYPTALLPQVLEWASIKAGVQHQSPFNGGLEAVEFPGERWRANLTLPTWHARNAKAALAEAFFARLAGGVERVRLHHFMRPVPAGTLRGTPTLAAAAVRGDLQLLLATTGTLRAGDLFKVGNQVFQAFADCTPAAGTLTVPLVQRVRAPLAFGAAVLWDRPTALFVMPATSSAAGYSPGMAAPLSAELVEVFA